MTFTPHPLLRGAHRQTIYGAFGRRPPALTTRRERFELPDGDFVDLEHLGLALGPRAVLLHGLGGSAQSAYIRALAATLSAEGWAVTLFQFRGASGPNRLPRTYHSGDTADIALVLAALRSRTSDEKLVAVGFSMGGNVLLKLLGEHGTAAVIDAGVAVSVPFRLAVCSDQLASGPSQVYGRYLIAGRLRALRAIRPLVAPHIDYERALRATNFRTLDGLVTAPLNGFASAADYYERASSLGFLGAIRRPTLILHALDDPFMTPAAVPSASDLASDIELEVHPHGGHVGFIERGPKGLPRSFIEQRVARWLRPYQR